MTTSTDHGLTFDAPGPGSWELDGAHFPRPLFGPLESIFPPAFREGMRDCCTRYGMLLDTLEVRFVHGFPYLQPQIAGVPSGGKPPPRVVMRVALALLTRLHPKLRRRMAVAKTVFERKPWREELALWDAQIRPATIASHARLAAIDPATLEDAQLADHLRAVEEHAIRMLRQDHSYNLAVMVPLGDYLAHAHDWTGLAQHELIAPLSGYSPISAGEAEERAALVAALRADAGAQALLGSSAPAVELWRQLADRPGEVGRAARAFQLVFGNGLTHGIDLALPTVNELPGPVLAGLRASLRGTTAADPRRAANEAAARVRQQVPEAARATFDELLAEARLTYRLRDERHLYGIMPTFGITRRALLEAGRRLRARTALPDEELAIVARIDELDAALRTRADLPVGTLLERRRLHGQLHAGNVPAHLGPAPTPPPPPEWLPNEGARRLMRALDLYLGDLRRDAGESQSEPEVVQGLAASHGIHEGTARLCGGVQDLDRITPGDVLVAPLTSPAINNVLPVLGAIVTDKGGALSHAAIVSREYGIPCVVGTRSGTARIPDGRRVRVDGTRGVVTVLA